MSRRDGDNAGAAPEAAADDAEAAAAETGESPILSSSLAAAAARALISLRSIVTLKETPSSSYASPSSSPSSS